jgi:hypothetical protein
MEYNRLEINPFICTCQLIFNKDINIIQQEGDARTDHLYGEP